jgi:hypothetical protein
MKRGEITSEKIIGIMLAILGFIVVSAAVFLIFGVNSISDPSDEACRLSVLTRATVPTASQSLIPLKCQTKKVCLKSSSLNPFKNDDCEQFAGEKEIKNVKVPNSPEQGSDKIEETSAQLMFDCWSMMGEGKLDLFSGQESISKVPLGETVNNYLKVFENKNKPKCVICSRISLSEELKNNNLILDKVDINDYLKSTQVPHSSETYLQRFTDSQVRGYPRGFKDELSKDKTYGTDQIAVVFMQFLTEDDTSEVALDSLAVGAVIVGGVMLTPVGWFGAPVLIAGLAGIGANAAFGAHKTSAEKTLAAAQCGQFETTSERARQGCSIITIIDYDKLKDLNTQCDFESLP